MVGLGGAAYAGNLGHLIVENGRADETGDDGCNNLGHEGDTGRDVNVMGQLEILSEEQGVGSRHVTV